MIAKLLLLSLAQAAVPQEPAAPEAGALISKAIARYYDAPSLVGRIRMTQTAKGVSIAIETEVQYSRPSQLYLRQVRNGSNPREIAVVSDGKTFAYDRPEGTLGPKKFTEFVTQNGYQQTVKDLYAAAGRTVMDRSPVLDIAIGRKADLQAVVEKLGTKKISGRVTVVDQPAVVIEGNYHDLPGEEPTGTFRMVITDSGDIVQFAQKQRFRVPDKIAETIEILTTWDASLKVGAKPDELKFRAG